MSEKNEKIQEEKIGEIKYIIHFETFRKRYESSPELYYSTVIKIYENEKQIAKAYFSDNYPGDLSDLTKKLKKLYEIYSELECEETREQIKKEMLTIIAKLLYKIASLL